MLYRLPLWAAAATMIATTASLAQTPQPAAPTQAGGQTAATQTSEQKPAAKVAPANSLSIYFDTGSAEISQRGDAVLDKAARTYREGQPIIMVVSGAADSTGPAALNLHLSQLRADNVLKGLVARGIPVGRFQVLAKGQTEPAVPAPDGTAEAKNRRVVISWR